MWRATWKGLLGHKLRLVLTALAIFLGTSFVAGSYVFTDTLGGLFDNLFSEAFAGTDVLVQGSVNDDLSFVQAQRFDPAVLDDVRAVDGVAAAEATVGGFANLATLDGEILGGQGPPTLGSAWIEVGNPFQLRDGRAPEAPDELVLDKASADRFRLTVGDRVQVIALGRAETFEIVGLIGLGTSDGFGGATAIGVEFDTADRIFGAEGQIDAINVVGQEGIDPSVLAERIQPVLPDGVEALDARLAAEEQLEGFKDALGFINTFLLVFGLVALFAGTFLIQNTFQIIVAQRTRELAMLRAIGATRSQILAMVMGEASIVATVASAAGVAGGVGLAVAIRMAFQRFGGAVPDSDLVLRPRTVVIALITGFVVTLISALVPALTASRIPPVAAMREAAAPPRRKTLRVRAVIGTILSAAGLGLLLVGLRSLGPRGISPVAIVGAGAGSLFVGVSVLTPLFVRPVGRTLGAPVSATGTVGVLARENAVRSPRRTAATSSSIMIGTALASLALILGASLDATTEALIADRFRSDLIVQPTGFGGGAQLSPELAIEIADLPEVAASTGVRRNTGLVEGDLEFIGGTDMAVLAQLVRFEVVEGDLMSITDGQVALSSDLADASGLSAGDDVTLTFGATGDQVYEIAAIFEADGPGAEAYLTTATWDANFTERFDSVIYVDLTEDTPLSEGRRALLDVTANYPGSDVLDQNQFADEAKTQIRRFIGLVFALLALTLLIGFVGILNTLLLSIIERTREIGLLRAVGTTRRQLSAMISWEAVIVSVFGAVLGVALGIFFGWAVIASLQADDVEIILAVPGRWLGTALAAAAIAGVVASVYPAWRASRLNVLDAIAYE
jgi:putative ABC transport system permease protein